MIVYAEFIVFLFLFVSIHVHTKDYLSVHENVYEGVVDRAAFSQINRYGCDHRVNIQTGVYDDSQGHGSIWQPCDEEGQHHHHHHTCHLHLHTICPPSLRYLQLGHLGDQDTQTFYYDTNNNMLCPSYVCLSPDGESTRDGSRTR